MSANSVYRVVIDEKPDAPPDIDRWIAMLNRSEEWSYVNHLATVAEKVTEAYAVWRSWRGGERFRYFSIEAARQHVGRLAAHGVIAHVEGGTIAWVTK